MKLTVKITHIYDEERAANFLRRILGNDNEVQVSLLLKGELVEFEENDLYVPYSIVGVEDLPTLKAHNFSLHGYPSENNEIVQGCAILGFQYTTSATLTPEDEADLRIVIDYLETVQTSLNYIKTLPDEVRDHFEVVADYHRRND